MISRDETERLREAAEELLRDGVFRGGSRLLADVSEDDDPVDVVPAVDRPDQLLLGREVPCPGRWGSPIRAMPWYGLSAAAASPPVHPGAAVQRRVNRTAISFFIGDLPVTPIGLRMPPENESAVRVRPRLPQASPPFCSAVTDGYDRRGIVILPYFLSAGQQEKFCDKVIDKTIHIVANL